jgi:hypothetical protein
MYSAAHPCVKNSSILSQSSKFPEGNLAEDALSIKTYLQKQLKPKVKTSTTDFFHSN